MLLTVSPSQHLHGSLSLPGDKSLSHRAALFSAIAEGESAIDNFLDAGVTRVMLRSLSGLGVAWDLSDGCLTVPGKGLGGLRSASRDLDCGNSATTLRLLAGALAAAGIKAVLDGSQGLRSRPMNRIVEPLRRMGVLIEATPQGTAPLRISARAKDQPLTALNYTMPVASAQVKTCLLLAALAADAPTTIGETELSRDHSERMLTAMGVDIRSIGTQVTLYPSHPVKLDALRMRLPGDISSAAFLIVAALITPGSQITLEKVLLNPSRTGLLDALQGMGANITIWNQTEQAGEPVGDLTVCSSELSAMDVDASLAVRMIDEFPAFAVAALFARGRTVVRGAAELRHKESDRITSLCAELRKLGGWVDEFADGFTIHGGRRLTGGGVDPYGDHRLAMALAVAGLASEEPVGIRGAEIIAKSFPNFIEVLRSLGARLSVSE